MDKETLSNYGWIVICVMVLAVMLALASPFGNFVADAIKSTTQGLFDVNQGALDAAGIQIMEQEFDTMLNGPAQTYKLHYRQPYNLSVIGTDYDGSEMPVDMALFFYEDGTVVCVDVYFLDGGDVFGAGNETYSYTLNENVVEVDGLGSFVLSESGRDLRDPNPDVTEFLSLDNDAIYLDDEYFYCYNSNLNGYSVMAKDRNKSSYSPIPSKVNGIDVVSTYLAFTECNNLTTVPSMPQSIVFSAGMFGDCAGLKNITLPALENIGYSAFAECDNLQSVVIPSSVKSIDSWVFYKCTNLRTITFEGTVAQWNAISFGEDWKLDVPATEVICSDGRVSLS